MWVYYFALNPTDSISDLNYVNIQTMAKNIVKKNIILPQRHHQSPTVFKGRHRKQEPPSGERKQIESEREINYFLFTKTFKM